MLLNVFISLVTLVVIPILFIINTLFKLCVSKKYKFAYFYYNFFIYYFSFGLTCILGLPVFILRQGDPSISGAFRHILDYVARIIDLELTIQNPEELAKDRAAVVVQNHQSSLDLMINLFTWGIGKKIIGVLKKEVQYSFPLGLVNYLTGSCFLTRNNRNQAYEELKKLKENMLKKRAKAWFFPEGTRNRNKEQFLPFKKGAFYLAVATQVPIIPVVTSPYYFLNYEKPSFEKSVVIMRILEAVPTMGLTKDDVPQLMQTVRKRMWEEYKQLYDDVMPNGPRASSE